MPSWVALACGLIAVGFTARILHRINCLEGLIMTEAQDAVDAVVSQLGKAKDEVLGKIADLEAQVAAGETPDFTALKAAAQALDDVVPDVEPEV